MRDVKIVVVGSGSSSDAFRDRAALLRRNEIRATDVNDMVQQILGRLGPNDRVRELVIIDHGNRQGQSIGSDWVSARNLHNLVAFARLRPRMAPDAVVTLHGCQVGHAAAMMMRLSQALGGVRVRAGTAYQRNIPGLEGGVRECREMVCTYSGAGFWDWVGR